MSRTSLNAPNNLAINCDGVKIASLSTQDKDSEKQKTIYHLQSRHTL